MKKLDLKTVPDNVKKHPLFKGLSEELKDPKCYKGIESKLQKAVYSDHQHKTIKKYMECPACSKKLQKKRELMKEMGFKSYEQYVLWRKIMEIINKKQNFQLK